MVPAWSRRAHTGMTGSDLRRRPRLEPCDVNQALAGAKLIGESPVGRVHQRAGYTLSGPCLSHHSIERLNISLPRQRDVSSGDFKHELFDQFARVGKALASGPRLELLEYLAQGERSVEGLATVSGLTVANTSRHLQQLRQSGLVAARKQGQQVFYRLAGEDVVALLNTLRQVAERRVAEVDRLVASYLTVKDGLEAVPARELLERVREGLVTVLDVRPPEEYAAGHLPGAVNVPLADLERCLGDCDPAKEVVAYCRGPWCVLAYDAVTRLREKGFKARRLEGGLPEWRQAGLPVEPSS